MILLVMGVSGSGKSTVGELLAQRLGWTFIDADAHHPPANVAKMAAGTALTDEDRWPWLQKLNGLLKRETNAVLACSALKESYRLRLADGVQDFRVVYLKGSPELLRQRVTGRKHKYMPASLLDSQLATLEPPAGAIEVDIAADPQACVEQVLSMLTSP